MSKKDKDLMETMKEALEESNKRAEAEYDGLLGSLPCWIPEPLKSEFVSVRGSLLNEYDEEAVREFLNNRKKLLTPSPNEYVRTSYTPPSIYPKLDALIYIQNIVDLGKDKGIKAYNGEEGVEVVKGIVKLTSKSKGGDTTAKIRKENALSDYKNINEQATSLISNGKDKKDIANIIADKTGFSKPKIYRALKTHPSGRW